MTKTTNLSSVLNKKPSAPSVSIPSQLPSTSPSEPPQPSVDKNQLQQKALIACTLEFKYADDVPFIECPCITAKPNENNKEKLNEKELANDDLKREAIFLDQAKSAFVLARSLIEQAKVPFYRPTDYFAEMVKTDVHMQKLQQHVVTQLNQVKRSEQRAKIQYQKKYGKQVRAHVLQERKAKEKSLAKKIGEIKKKRKIQANAHK